MKKQYRIKKSEDIEQVLKKKNSVGNKNYIIYIMKNSEAKNFRLAMSVSKKLGNAVFRNKYKRKIRAIVDNYKKNYVNNKDCIIILKRCAQDSTFEELSKDFNVIIEKIRKDN